MSETMLNTRHGLCHDRPSELGLVLLIYPDCLLNPIIHLRLCRDELLSLPPLPSAGTKACAIIFSLRGVADEAQGFVNVWQALYCHQRDSKEITQMSAPL